MDHVDSNASHTTSPARKGQDNVGKARSDADGADLISSGRKYLENSQSNYVMVLAEARVEDENRAHDS